MQEFVKLVYTPPGLGDITLAIAACRAGAVGVVNGELQADSASIVQWLDRVAAAGATGYGLRVDRLDDALHAALQRHARSGLRWLILDPASAIDAGEALAALRQSGVALLVEIKTPIWPLGLSATGLDGLVLKGNEAGGFVGENSSFILLQKWLGATGLPLYVHGGITPHVAAACSAVGVAGGVLDAQLWLLDEAGLPAATRDLLGGLSGTETVAAGDGERGEYFRVLSRPGHLVARDFIAAADGQGFPALRSLVQGKVQWAEPKRGLLPVGQDICFAAGWRKSYRHMAAVVQAIDAAVGDSLRIAVQARAIAEEAPLAQALGVRFPVVQGPMTRVSDVAEFALAVAAGGALPMVAFALLKGAPLEALLDKTSRLLQGRPWGIGLLGFAPQWLLDEQLASATRFKPHYAIIAGGRPDQAVRLEQAGVPSFLHVPAAALIPMFLHEGARRFIFEGRECGGHIGPLSSFVLWSTMVDKLLAELAANKAPAADIQLLFAGGVHDAASSAMVQVLVAPLVAKGVKVGVLMGSAYLFTQEIVGSGAIVPRFQQAVLDCEQTASLESGPGHASRCAYTPFAQEFFRTRVEMRTGKVAADESRRVLDDLILGRLRIASKGRNRSADSGELQDLDEAQQYGQGMYMLGQVATLRSTVTDIQTLHGEVTDGAAALLAQRLDGRLDAAAPATQQPVDIAIIGMASLLPKANTTQDYWENILDKVDGITEIPKHRWDWRLYFDADRSKRDKIYSKWGGFLDDLLFDPTRYGMPPKSLEAIDPMQLMALEVARRTLVDAGYHEKGFDAERASVIIGASGGGGDMAAQYGLRSELPRFNGELPDAVADRLPEWTEDSFAGILLNVVAGRIANRLNFGGVNFTTDAACASSLTAIYQGVSELAAGRCDFVISGGVDTVQGPFGYLCFSKTQALSPRGRCATFDQSGDGIVISEGIAMVALKRLADAERDGDRIYAVIKGAGGSSDGNAKGMTAPLPAGQLRAMRRAYAQAGFGPASVGLFEAHGTGTVAGDTAELESTTRLMHEQGTRPRSAVIGSVKTMIGHTKATAGVAGMIKAALALHHRVLPPHRGVASPNPILDSADAPLYLVDEAVPWLGAGGVPRRAAVSAFGFGGTNFHIVLEEYSREYRDWLRPATSRRWPAELLLWSADDKPALAARVAALQAELPSLAGIALRDLAASLAAQPRSGAERMAIVARDTQDLAAKLAAAAAHLAGDSRPLPPGVHQGHAAAPAGKVAVLFPGQGSQFPGMGRELALHFPVCAQALGEADTLLANAFGDRFGAGTQLSQFIFPRGSYGEAGKTAARKALTATDVAQPALGAVEIGMFRLMQSLGLAPDMLAGHSYGEFVALHAGGAIDFDALMALSAARGRFIVDAARAEGAELGTMAAVQALRKDVDEAIADIDGVIIANHNAPMQSIVSGSRDAVKAAVAKLAAAGIDATEIPVAAAFHSSMVKPAQKLLSQMIEATPWKSTATPVYSNTEARLHAADVSRTKRLMADHLVRPVEFVAEVEAMYKDGARIFVEIGPKSVLTRLTTAILEGQPHLAVAIDDGGGLTGLLNALGRLVCAGVPVDTAALFAGRECRVVDPSRLAVLKPDTAVPKVAWLLNGSGARRASDPVRQIGVTLEEAQAALADLPATTATSATSATSAATTVAAATPAATRAAVAPPIPQPLAVAAAPVLQETARTAPPQPWRKDRSMDDRRPTHAPADAGVMSDYFATMRQFLETQERVMSVFMGSEPAAARPSARPAVRLGTTDSVPRGNPALAFSRVADVAPAAVIAVRPPAAVPAPPPLPVAPLPVLAAAAPQAPAVIAEAKPAAAPAPAPAKPAAVAASGAMSRDALTSLLLGIVEERTGYPRDMVGLDQNLESDLGIDSIKRIEVVGALLQMLPEHFRLALTENRSKLNTQPTLNGLLDLLVEAEAAETTGGAVTVPFELAETGHRAPVSHLSRQTIQTVAEPVIEHAARRLQTGHFLFTRDAGGVADALAQRLVERGCSVAFVSPALLADDAALAAWCREQAAGGQALAGLVHLAPMAAQWLAGDAAPALWRLELQRSEKSLFTLLHGFSGRLADGAHVLAASALGGSFGRAGAPCAGLSLQGGAVGLLKSLQEERPGLRLKAVDLDPAQPAIAAADALFTELELDGGRLEVGYPGGQRSIFRTVATDAVADPSKQASLQALVVLATGGARGITAEVLRELARPGNTLVLTGRSSLPEHEDQASAVLADADALRRHFIAQVRSGALQMKPAEIQRRIDSLLGLREMRANIADFRSQGAQVEYHAVDVTDEAAMQALVDGVVQRHGAIVGVVHGAGVIEDKLLADKTGASWSRVVETKVMGLLSLQRCVAKAGSAGLRFFTVFSSVAGRYGNSGQSDYATANELMNRLCCQLRSQWDARVHVSALCWGPWGATKFGAGMVTAETEAKFNAKGVTLVSAAVGRRLFHDDWTRQDSLPVEVICAAGAWEQHEAALGAMRQGALPAPAPWLGPLLGPATVSAQPNGDQIVALHVDTATHAYLLEHRMDGIPVMPAAAALEIVAEAARSLWPGWKVVEVREFRLMKGVDMKEPARALRVLINPAPYGSSEGFEVNAALQSDLGAGRALTHYRCVVRLEQQWPVGDRCRAATHGGIKLSVTKAYDDWLFHGPRFQVIERIHGLSAAGAGATVRSSEPAQWVDGLVGTTGTTDGWAFDPALVDAAAQMAQLWAHAHRGESALPTRFGRVVRYRAAFPARMRMDFECAAATDPSLVRANVHFFDEQGDMVMLIEDLESVSSPALNRLIGTVRAVVRSEE